MTDPTQPVDPASNADRPVFAPPPGPAQTPAAGPSVPTSTPPQAPSRSAPSTWSAATSAPTEPFGASVPTGKVVPHDRSTGRGVGSVVAAAVLAALLASGGTAAVVGLLVPPAPVASTPVAPNATTTSTGSTTITAGDLTAIVAADKQSVVTITADGLTTDRFSPFGQPTTGIGSGIILTADGYILTNRHVVENSTSLTVETADGSTYPARLVEQAKDNDLALIKVDATGLSPARIADSCERPGRRDGHRHRQPARHLHRDRDQGHRVRPRPGRHGRRRVDRALDQADRPHPDRRRDQPRQQRRAAARRLGRRDRHQHRRRVHGPGPGLRDPHQRRRRR